MKIMVFHLGICVLLYYWYYYYWLVVGFVIIIKDGVAMLLFLVRVFLF